MVPNSSKINSSQLLEDLRQLIELSKGKIARSVNSEMTFLYWHIGKKINETILHHDRADYGEKIFETLSQKLKSEYGSGFSARGLSKMVQFSVCFPDFQILPTLSAKLSWSHFVELLTVKEELKRNFYAEMCRIEGWSVRTLHDKIKIMFFERIELSKKPEHEIEISLSQIREKDIISLDMMLNDPYVLSFLKLPDNHYENDLEEAILNEIEKFMLELGTSFSFVARQKRFTIDKDHYYLDLLFYNRRLKRLCAVELKKGKFQAAYKGQMELYLRWLDRYNRLEGEEAPIGIILCTEKSSHQIELLGLTSSGIHVAEYLTEIPSATIFEKKIQEIVETAKEKLMRQRQSSHKKIIREPTKPQ